ncbi:hypothetical protein PAPHI01_2535 [Pancytospora philotis]|nr:hypothetical protein PAPHI01_2535 [Pancytospora philotis]
MHFSYMLAWLIAGASLAARLPSTSRKRAHDGAPAHTPQLTDSKHSDASEQGKAHLVALLRSYHCLLRALRGQCKAVQRSIGEYRKFITKSACARVNASLPHTTDPDAPVKEMGMEDMIAYARHETARIAWDSVFSTKEQRDVICRVIRVLNYHIIDLRRAFQRATSPDNSHLFCSPIVSKLVNSLSSEFMRPDDIMHYKSRLKKWLQHWVAYERKQAEAYYIQTHNAKEIRLMKLSDLRSTSTKGLRNVIGGVFSLLWEQHNLARRIYVDRAQFVEEYKCILKTVEWRTLTTCAARVNIIESMICIRFDNIEQKSTHLLYDILELEQKLSSVADVLNADYNPENKFKF